MENIKNIKCESPEPYPPVTVNSPNPQYADMMLSNLGGQVSEMSAVASYIYDHFVTKDDEALSTLLKRIAITEMRHMDIFGELTLLLGGDPRFWEKSMLGMRYWTPACLTYNTRPRAVLETALNSELKAISKYSAQMEQITDEHIRANLARIIKDEEVHAEIFRGLLEE